MSNFYIKEVIVNYDNHDNHNLIISNTEEKDLPRGRLINSTVIDSINIAEMADYVIVMYAGRIIEKGTAMEIFDNPMHPYTIGLQKSKPRIDAISIAYDAPMESSFN